MLFLLYIAALSLATSAVIVAAARARLPRFVVVAPGLGAGALLGWLTLRPFLPLNGTVLTFGPTEWRYTVNADTTWPLVFLFLLVAVASLLWHDESARDAWPTSRAAVLVLLPAAILVLSSDLTPAGGAAALAPLLLLLLLWALMVKITSPRSAIVERASLLALALPGIWFLFGVDFPGTAATERITSWVLLGTAGLQLGALGLHWWRPLNQTVSPHLAPFLHHLPLLGGVAVILALLGEAGGAAPGSALLPTTVLRHSVLLLLLVSGGLLTAAAIAFRRRHAAPQKAVAALAAGAAGWILLTATTGDGRLVLLEAGALWVGSAMLFLTISRPLPDARFHWSHLAPYAAIGALAGVPPLAGRGGVFALSPDAPSGWILTGLLVVSQALFTAAAVRLFWDSRAGEAPPPARQTAALFLPLLGFTLLAPAAGAIGAQGWILSLVTAAAGVGLAATIDGARGTRLDAALEWRSAAAGRLGGGIRRTAAAAGDAIQQAVALLEGEGALLWLLFLLVIFGLARL